MPEELNEIVINLNRLYLLALEGEDISKSISRMDPIELYIWNVFEKYIPRNKFGIKFLSNKKNIYSSLKKTQQLWEAELDAYEKIVQGGADQVLEFYKENIAEKKSKQTGQEIDPEDIEDDELDSNELYKWYKEEWNHNISKKHWLVDHVEKSNIQISLNNANKRGLKGAIDWIYIIPFKYKGKDLLDGIKRSIDFVDNRFNNKRIFKWIFGDDKDLWESTYEV